MYLRLFLLLSPWSDHLISFHFLLHSKIQDNASIEIFSLCEMPSYFLRVWILFCFKDQVKCLLFLKSLQIITTRISHFSTPFHLLYCLCASQYCCRATCVYVFATRLKAPWGQRPHWILPLPALRIMNDAPKVQIHVLINEL